jgi:hypothetical protein
MDFTRFLRRRHRQPGQEAAHFTGRAPQSLRPLASLSVDAGFRHLGEETAMQELLRRACGLIQKLQQRQPTVRFGGSSSRDWLPPVLGPSDWSYGLMHTMADSNTAWYFDRR